MKGNALQLFRNILYTPLQTVCKLNNNGVLRSTSFIQNSKIYQEKYTPITYSWKELHSSSTLNENTGRHRIILGETKGITSTKLRGPMIDESDNITENLGALEAASLAAEANEDLAQELESKDNFQLYPDETTGDTLFNGVKFKDLPYVTIICTYNHTKFYANAANGTKLLYTTPRVNGFVHAKKRSSVAGQATGLIVGQKLRQMNHRTVRVRIDGFNTARIASILGITQAGINVVSISDVTPVDWGWCQRAKKRKRKN